MSQKKSSERKAKVAKAGKRSGAIKLTTPNPEKAAAREAGRQQFVARVRPKPVQDVDPEAARMWDTGYRYDASRKAMILPPEKPQAPRKRGAR